MASDKHYRALKREPIKVLSSHEATLLSKPRYDGFACGHGVHGDTKYNRARVKREWEARATE